MMNAVEQEQMGELISERVRAEITALLPRMIAAEQSAEKANRHAEEALRLVEQMREDLYGDPGKRSGPASLYERLEQIDQAAQERHEAMVARMVPIESAIRRWTRMEQAAMTIAASGAISLVRRLLGAAIMIGLTLGLSLGFYIMMKG